jgi:hypothetical protein
MKSIPSWLFHPITLSLVKYPFNPAAKPKQLLAKPRFPKDRKNPAIGIFPFLAIFGG